MASPDTLGNDNLLPNQMLELRIERMSYGSAAIARHNGFVIFVHGNAAPGDLAKIRLVKKSKNYWDAELIEIVAASPHRIRPPCSYFGQCGGCQWQHIDYEQQLLEKRNIVLHQISRATGMMPDQLSQVTQSVPSPKSMGYRNRVQVRGTDQAIGFFKSGTRQLVPIDDCQLLEDPLRNKWRQFQNSDEHHRIAQKSSEDYFKIEWTLVESGAIKQAVNAPHAAEGFTQINSLQNEHMVSIVTKSARACANQYKQNNETKDIILLDLYSGTGNLSQLVKDDFTNIICVESFLDKSFLNEKKTSALNDKRTFVCSDVRKYLEKTPLKKVNCIIADPPREGLGKAAGLIAKLGAETVILVSCDPSTLARDLTHFAQPHYEIETLYVMDMFPQTFHIETIVVLKKVH